jgi:3-methyladenine DNA glycosylase AlkC
MESTNRKGARRIAEIPEEVLEALNSGKLETANLVEWLAIDHQKLWISSFASVLTPEEITGGLNALKAVAKPGINSKNAAIGAYLSSILSQKKGGDIYAFTHTSDMVRGWYCYSIASRSDLVFAQKLQMMQPLAADAHFGVREVAWMALRPYLALELELGLNLLQPWVLHPHEGIRRFACEITRPCGVWCAHLLPLKHNPTMALDLLNPLRADTSRYVQNSVANWLNDASKSQPEWVMSVCDRWLSASDTPATRYIAKRALRTIQ